MDCMKITLTGTGTSHGIPVIGCDCRVCQSPDPRDKRLRCSAFVEHGNESFVIDTGPEFRMQALKYHINHLDAVLITHSHADHCHGLDDLRIYSVRKDEADKTSPDKLPVYCNATTKRDLIFRFAYIFKRRGLGGGIPNIKLRNNSAYSGKKPLVLGDVEVIPVPIMHGRLKNSGWLLRCTGKDGRIHSVVYLTDCNFISRKSLELVKKYGGHIDHLVIDGLRRSRHSTHCNFDEALSYADIICAEHTWITHISHDIPCSEISEYIHSHLDAFPGLRDVVSRGGSAEPSYDGLVLYCGE